MESRSLEKSAFESWPGSLCCLFCFVVVFFWWGGGKHWNFLIHHLSSQDINGYTGRNVNCKPMKFWGTLWRFWIPPQWGNRNMPGGFLLQKGGKSWYQRPYLTKVFFLTGYWWWWHCAWLGRKDCSMGWRWFRTKSSFLSRTNGLTQRLPQRKLESNNYWIANS